MESCFAQGKDIRLECGASGRVSQGKDIRLECGASGRVSQGKDIRLECGASGRVSKLRIEESCVRTPFVPQCVFDRLICIKLTCITSITISTD